MSFFVVVIVGGFFALYAIRRKTSARHPVGPQGQGQQTVDEIASGLGGFLIGSFVGYMLSSPPSSLSLSDVLSRGVWLSGMDTFMRPAAEHAFNWMAAFAVLGALGGIALASMLAKRTQQQAAAKTMVHCPACGASVSNGLLFCGQCGKPVAERACGKCGKPVPRDQQFCGSCGAPFTSPV